MSYATITHVQSRFQGFTFADGSTPSKPSQTQAETWIADAEGMIDGALNAAQLTSPCTNANGIKILRRLTCDYVDGQVRNALAASANDPSNTAGQALIDKFDARIQWILDNHGQAGDWLEGGDAPDGARGVRYPSNLDDNGDEIEPIFTRDETTSDLGSEF